MPRIVTTWAKTLKHSYFTDHLKTQTDETQKYLYRYPWDFSKTAKNRTTACEEFRHQHSGPKGNVNVIQNVRVCQNIRIYHLQLNFSLTQQNPPSPSPTLSFSPSALPPALSRSRPSLSLSAHLCLHVYHSLRFSVFLCSSRSSSSIIINILLLLQF